MEIYIVITGETNNYIYFSLWDTIDYRVGRLHMRSESFREFTKLLSEGGSLKQIEAKKGVSSGDWPTTINVQEEAREAEICSDAGGALRKSYQHNGVALEDSPRDRREGSTGE